MIPVQMSCQIPTCDYRADWSGEPIAQWNEMQYHLDNDHDFRRKGMALMSTAYAEMWHKLDEYVKQAMENPGDPIHGAKGRGLAEGMSILFSFNRKGDEWDTADKVIAASVACYEADQNGTHHVPRYGINKNFRIPGSEEIHAYEPETTAAPSGPSAIKQKLANVKDQLKAAVEGGIDIEMLASTYRCSEDDIKEAIA